MIIDNAFDITPMKERAKEVIEESKDISYVVNVLHMGVVKDQVKLRAIKFLNKRDDPQADSNAKQIEKVIESIEKQNGYKQIYEIVFNSYNYIRKVAGKEEYNPLTKQENPSHSSES